MQVGLEPGYKTALTVAAHRLIDNEARKSCDEMPRPQYRLIEPGQTYNPFHGGIPKRSESSYYVLVERMPRFEITQYAQIYGLDDEGKRERTISHDILSIGS